MVCLAVPSFKAVLLFDSPENTAFQPLTVESSVNNRERWLFDFHTAKGIAEFTAAVMAIIIGIVTLVTWLF